MKKRYPIGIQTFEKIVERNMRYIDKTGYVYDIANNYDYVFLSRPRRFGKSLLTSTLHSYFDGRKDLFKGFEMEKLETEWIKYPVLHFDISMAKHQTLQGLHNTLDYLLSCEEEKYGIEKKSDDENLRLSNLIKCCAEKYGQKVVVLIDEYDAPLLDVLNDEEALAANRQVMRNFYSPLKACDTYLRFVFITGITRFPQASIFSGFNNLLDISMRAEYSGICGITNEELLTQFSGGIDDFASRNGISREYAISKLKGYYEGYHFSDKCPDIYNPFSIINALDSARIDAYWSSSEIQSLLLEQMHRFGVTPQNISETIAMKREFYAPIDEMISITPLLYQLGYMTIKDYDESINAYTLGIPNREVSDELMNSVNFDSDQTHNITDWKILE